MIQELNMKCLPKFGSMVAALAAVVLLCPTTQGQTASDNPNGIHVSSRDNGSATQLAGSACIYHIFVADEMSGWSQNDVDAVVAAMRESLDFLSLQARFHGHDISFIEETAGIVTFDSDIPTDMFTNPAWTERVIQAAVMMSGNELMEDLRKRHQVDHVFIILHINKAALSYNLTFYDRVDPIYKAERTVCFTQYPDGRSTAAATYAHESLHVFGARDLYFPYDADDSRQQLAERLFPDDIMFRVDYDIAKLNIGAFTAYCIGWLDELPESLAALEQ